MRRKSGCKTAFLYEVKAMYKIGDVVVYGTEGLCKIVEITEKKFGKEIIEYYVLEQISGSNSTTYVPVHNEKSLSKMRHILKPEEITEIITNFPFEESTWIESDRERQKAFKDILIFGDSKDIIKLARTIYLHQKKQEEKGRKLHLSDERFLKDAERMIFDEIAFVMGIERENVLEFISNSMKTA